MRQEFEIYFQYSNSSFTLSENKLNHPSPIFREKHVVYFSLILIMLLFSAHFLVAQEKFGLTTSNFGGINAAQLNPAATFNSKLFLDINFLSGGFFLENNFLYIHKEDYNFMNYLSKKPAITWCGYSRTRP